MWPIGYPVASVVNHDAGHAWWKLTCDASCGVIKPRFTKSNCSLFLGGTGWGYGPDDTAQVLSWIPYIKEGPGHLYPGDGSQSVHRIYACGFQGPGLIDALDYTDNLLHHPGTWNSATNNCVHQVVNAGNKAGISLLGDTTPEFFGMGLPPSDP